jgi:hypothetical protein
MARDLLISLPLILTSIQLRETDSEGFMVVGERDERARKWSRDRGVIVLLTMANTSSRRS